MSIEEFSLPTTITILYARLVNGKYIAHCLDFDLLEAGDAAAEVSARLDCTIKTYVEFGLGKGWKTCIRHRAPQRFWDVLRPELPVEFGPPIMIANHKVPVIKAEPEYEALAAAGSA